MEGQLTLSFGAPFDQHPAWFTLSRRRLLRWAEWSCRYRASCRHPEAFKDWLDPAWLTEHTHPKALARVVAWTEGGDETTRVVRVEVEDRGGRTGGAWIVVAADLVHAARLDAGAH